MVKLVIVLFFVSLNFFWIKCGTKDPASDPGTCQQQTGGAAAQSNTACQSANAANVAACKAAAPTVSQLANEPCSTAAGRRKRDAHEKPCNNCSKKCFWKYYSKIVGQKVCVGERLVNGLEKGDIQFKLGTIFLTPCKQNGMQKCVGDYGRVTCNNGVWSVSAICDPDEVCKESLQSAYFGMKYKAWLRFETPVFFENKKIQKAKCVPSYVGRK